MNLECRIVDVPVHDLLPVFCAGGLTVLVVILFAAWIVKVMDERKRRHG